MKKTTRIVLRIAPEQKTRIQNYCKETNLTLSELIRYEIDKKTTNERK